MLLALAGCGGDERAAVTTVASAELVEPGALHACAGPRAPDLERALVREIGARLALEVDLSETADAIGGVLAGRCDVAVDRVRVTYPLQGRVSLLGYIQIDRGADAHVRYAFVMPKKRDSLYFGIRGAMTTMNEDGTMRRLFDEAGLEDAHVLGTA